MIQRLVFTNIIRYDDLRPKNLLISGWKLLDFRHERVSRVVRTTRLPMTTVAKKNGMHVGSPTSKQSHMDSIHSPHNTRNTIMNECRKSVKFHLGSSWSLNMYIFSAKIQPISLPITVDYDRIRLCLWLCTRYLCNFSQTIAFP